MYIYNKTIYNMGYQITFVPTEEKMKEFKPWDKDSEKNLNDTIKSIKREIISICLKGNQEKSIYQLEKDLTFKLGYLRRCIHDSEKYNAYSRWENDEEHELWYCGWEFSHENRIDEDDLIDDVLDRLLILADVVKTADYFDESERFCDKWNEIRDELNGLEDSIQDIAIHEIIKQLDGFEKKYGDEDEEENNDTSEFKSGSAGLTIGCCGIKSSKPKVLFENSDEDESPAEEIYLNETKEIKTNDEI